MKTEDFLLLSFPQVLCYDEPDAGEADTGADAGEAGAGAEVDSGSSEKTFTQAQLNEFLAADRRRHQEQTKKVQEQAKQMEERLQKLIADKNTSEAHRQSLQNDL